MNIAILTQPLGRNYGGILQAFALQTYLKQQGCSVVTIDRKKPLPIIEEPKLNSKQILKTIIGTLRNIPVNTDPEFIYEHLYVFKNNHLTMSSLFNEDQAVINHFKDNAYDLVIVGSDQVWRPKYSPSIGLYFGDFIEKANSSARLMSYAASFGVDHWEFTNEESEYCKKLIQTFSTVTVREDSGINLCKKHFNIEADQVVDPTLLLKREDYEQLLPRESSTLFSGKVLNYVLDPDEKKQNIAKTVATQLSKGVAHVLPQDKSAIKRLYRVNPEKYIPIEDWLQGFRDCEYVVTDSFHGCIFSIIFNKPFIAIGNAERGLARFNTLFNMFELQDRLILSDEELTIEKINSEINWASINPLVKNFSQKGRGKLTEQIQLS